MFLVGEREKQCRVPADSLLEEGKGEQDRNPAETSDGAASSGCPH